MYELGVVYRNITRADRAAADGQLPWASATVHEAMGRVGLLKYMRPIQSGVQVSGTAVTGAAARRQLDDAWWPSRSSPATSGGGHHRRSATTATLATCWPPASRRARAALIIDAGVRDVKTLQEMNFPVWSKCISSKGCIKETLGSVNIPVVCAGMLVTPGDVIVADDDGVGLRARCPGGTDVGSCAKRESLKAKSAPSWPAACWGWTCTRCASRWKRRACATSTDLSVCKQFQ